MAKPAWSGNCITSTVADTHYQSSLENTEGRLCVPPIHPGLKAGSSPASFSALSDPDRSQQMLRNTQYALRKDNTVWRPLTGIQHKARCCDSLGSSLGTQSLSAVSRARCPNGMFVQHLKFARACLSRHSDLIWLAQLPCTASQLRW